MLIEVIFCVLAVLLLLGGGIAILFLRVGSRRRDMLAIKALWFSIIAAIPLSLHLPVALLCYHGTQILGHLPRYMLDDPRFLAKDAISVFLGKIADVTTMPIFHLAIYPFAAAFLFVLSTTSIIAIARRLGHLSWWDYGYVLLIQITAWGYVLFSYSLAWWFD